MPKETATRKRANLRKDLGVLDLPYLLLTLLLVGVGLIVLFSASYARAYYLTGNSAS